MEKPCGKAMPDLKVVYKEEFFCSSGVVHWLCTTQGAVDMQTHTVTGHQG